MSLVCLGDEAAAGRVATMAGWATRMIFDTSDRSEGTMDCSIDGESVNRAVVVDEGGGECAVSE